MICVRLYFRISLNTKEATMLEDNRRSDYPPSTKFPLWIIGTLVVIVIGVVLAYYYIQSNDSLRNRLVDQAVNWLVTQKSPTDDDIHAAMRAVEIHISAAADVDDDQKIPETYQFLGIPILKQLAGSEYRHYAKIYVFAGSDQQVNPVEYRRKGKQLTLVIPHTQILPHMSSVDVNASHTTVESMGVANRVGVALDACQGVITLTEDYNRDSLSKAIKRVRDPLIAMADRQMEMQLRNQMRLVGFNEEDISVEWVEPLSLTID